MSDKTNETRRPMLRPGSTVCETGDGRIQVTIEMPGVRQEHLEVRIEGNELRVLGRRDDQEGFSYLVRERRPGDFFQAWKKSPGPSTSPGWTRSSATGCSPSPWISRSR